MLIVPRCHFKTFKIFLGFSSFLSENWLFQAFWYGKTSQCFSCMLLFIFEYWDVCWKDLSNIVISKNSLIVIFHYINCIFHLLYNCNKKFIKVDWFFGFWPLVYLVGWVKMGVSGVSGGVGSGRVFCTHLDLAFVYLFKHKLYRMWIMSFWHLFHFLTVKQFKILCF